MKRATGVWLALDPERPPINRTSVAEIVSRGRAAEPARRRSVRLMEGFEMASCFSADADPRVRDTEVQLRAALGTRVFTDGDETWPRAVNLSALPTRFVRTWLIARVATTRPAHSGRCPKRARVLWCCAKAAA